MDLLQNYGSSSDEEEDKSKMIDPANDYLGLLSHSSESDQDEKCCSNYETYINAFNLRSDEFGPENQLEIKQNKRYKNVNAKTNRKKNFKKFKSEDELVKNPTECLKLNIELPKLPHPIISKFYHKNFKTVRLPENSNLRSEICHKSCVNSVRWGTQLASHHLLLSVSMDGSVKIYNAINYEKEMELCYNNNGIHGGQAVRCAQWHPVHDLILTGGFDKHAVITDIVKGEEIGRYSHPDFVYCLKVNSEEPNLFLTGSSSAVYCWDIRQNSEKLVKTYTNNFSDVKDVEFLPGGKEFLCCSTLVTRESADRNIVVWDFKSGAILSNQIFQERFHCTSLKVHPEGKQFLAQTNGDYIAAFSTKTPYKMNKNLRYEGHKVQGYWIEFDASTDGQFIYSGSADGKLYIYNYYNGDLARVLRISNQPLIAIQSHPVLSSTVAMSDYSGKIHVIY